MLSFQRRWRSEKKILDQIQPDTNPEKLNMLTMESPSGSQWPAAMHVITLARTNSMDVFFFLASISKIELNQCLIWKYHCVLEAFNGTPP